MCLPQKGERRHAPTAPDAQAMAATLDELRYILANLSETRPELVGRLERATLLVLFRQIMDLGEDRYRVLSEDGLRWYDIEQGACTCMDYRRHGPRHACKHTLAVALGQELGLLGNANP
jgi:hypothetical protein